jgi:Flp pilus assembly protein TadD
MKAPLAICLLAILGAWSAPVRADDPEAELIFNSALTHLKEGRPDLAIEEFERAIKKDPKNAHFRKGLGQAYLASQKPAQAIEPFRKALVLNPYFSDVRNDLGTALILAGKRDEGKRELIKAYDEPTNPTPEITARNLGQAYLEEKSYEQAVTWFRASAQRNKRFADSHVGLADALVALGRIEEAITGLESALIATADHPRVLLALGEAYYRAGRFVDARTRLTQAAKADANGPVGRRASELLNHLPK